MRPPPKPAIREQSGFHPIATFRSLHIPDKRIGDLLRWYCHIYPYLLKFFFAPLPIYEPSYLGYVYWLDVARNNQRNPQSYQLVLAKLCHGCRNIPRSKFKYSSALHLDKGLLTALCREWRLFSVIPAVRLAPPDCHLFARFLLKARLFTRFQQNSSSTISK